ncbi:hypothetical protein H072_8712 [Dactylellina haptotyla CBS 200.50]|uniref:Amino acid permease/ SLC12A domain-containing protein n=1 Tax=Dactylellina haptotyla (strain CBS 200.50) TaxID=1284197 RepID=S8BQQ1_DACHA|nr:hypothetical protein H072_8712 [Dactylellina haptotyla CBS 200.50]
MASYTNVPLSGEDRDSLELASLASSSHSRASLSSDSRSLSSSRRLSAELATHDDPLTLEIDDSETYAVGGGSRPLRQRSYSVGSTFDFNAHLFPLSASANDPLYLSLDPTTTRGPSFQNLEKQKSITYFNGLSLVVGLQIGSGIFSSPAQVNSSAGSPGAALLIWLLSGILAWTGASSYIELGGAIPLSGGAQAYLQHIFGDLPAFLFAWVAIMVMRPGSSAIISIIAGEYLGSVFWGALAEDSDPPPQVAVKALALLCLWGITILNCLSTKAGTRAGDVFLMIKLVSLIAITVIGIVVAVTGFSVKDGGPSNEWKTGNWFKGSSRDPGAYAVALYAGLWAFDGWDNVNYITGEMKNPSRDLPRVIHSAMPLVIVCYLLANISYFFVLPSSVIASSTTVAVRFGTTVFGSVGGILFALAVSISCVGALNATTFTSGRLVYVAGKQGYLPKLFGKLGVRFSRSSGRAGGEDQGATLKVPIFGTAYTRTPIYAMLLNAVLTSFFTVIGSFEALVAFYGVAGYSFYFLTVLGLIVLRYREPDLPRPYRCWIITPIVFCCVSLFLVSRGVFGAPIQTAGVVVFVLIGVVVFWVRVGPPKSLKRLGGKLRFWKKGRKEEGWSAVGEARPVVAE